MPAHPPSVYVHVGPPKTGTTFLQDVLWRHRTALAERGLTIPGSRPMSHFHAALDLRGLTFGGYDDPAVPGSWARVAGRARQAADKALITHEVLAGATVEQVAEVVASLAPAQVHVVYAARDLARQLPAVWQENLKNRKSRSFDRLLERTLDPDADRQRGFWHAQHPVEVLTRWSSAVPVERLHVITLPPAGGERGGTVLWERFCTALGVDGSGLDLEVARTNASLTAAQAEVLRRLNRSLAGLDWPTYERLVKRRFNRFADQGREGRRVKVPRGHRDALLARSEEVIAGLRADGYPVIGDLGDLRPSAASFGRGAGVKPAKVTGAAVQLLSEMLEESVTDEGVTQRARALMSRLQGRGSA